MRDLLLPDYVFSKFDDITPDFLISIGIKALLIDIDNTLAPYEVTEPDEKIIDWFCLLERNGISASLISNNEKERVEIFNRPLRLNAYYKSGKPFAKNLKAAMKKMGSDISNTAMLGDQLLTDAAAGKNIGLRTIIVPPIKDKNNVFFRSKRAMEVPVIRKYADLHKDVENVAEICSFWLERKYKKVKK